jgi:hypothetical protein
MVDTEIPVQDRTFPYIYVLRKPLMADRGNSLPNIGEDDARI